MAFREDECLSLGVGDCGRWNLGITKLCTLLHVGCDSRVKSKGKCVSCYTLNLVSHRLRMRQFVWQTN